MASTLSGPNIEEEYMWSVTLDGTNKEFSWKPTDPADEEDTEDEEDPSCKPNHRLLIKTAILHPDAAKDEVTMLQIETKGYKEEKVNAPFLAMKSGVNLQQYVDLLVPDLATIKIVNGSGPITLLGSHCVDFYDYRNYGADDTLEDEEEDAESSEDDEMDAEEQETVAVKKDVKKEEVKKEEVKEEEVAPVKEGKKKTPKKETPKKEKEEKEEKAAAKEEDKEKSPAKETKSKTPDSKKRKMSKEEEKSAEKKRKKSGSK